MASYSSRILTITIALASLIINSMTSPVPRGLLSHEECFRIQLYGHESVAEGDQRALYIQNARDSFCRSLGRGFYYAWRSTGKTGRLPASYIEALCNVLGDDQNVTGYVRSIFLRHDVDRLLGGRTCEDILKNNKDMMMRSEMMVVVGKLEDE